MPHDPAAAPDDRLHAVIAEYIQADEAGRPPNRTDLLARHPDLAEGLGEFFANHDRVREAVATLHPAPQTPPFQPAGAETIGASEPTGAHAPGKAAGTRFGDYELLDEIARGGMGVVIKARQVSLNRVVALKMILAGQFAAAIDVQRFRAEAEAAAALDHPNIVPLYEVGEHAGQHYFSMRLIEGRSLAEEVARQGAKDTRSQEAPSPLRSLRLCAQLLVAVARAVHYAHQRGILHRDLKPANILLDKEGQPHVTDFGLAKRVESGSAITRSGAVVGTPSYMAPEQARGEKALSTAADVYSLGAVLYELLTGRPPFRADNALDTLLHVLDRDPEPPRRLNPALNADLETICLKCLEKDPQRRYASAEELARDLERWLSGETILARPSTRWERTVKWARRRPAASALIAVSAASLVALLALAGSLWQNAELRAEAVQNLTKAQQDLEAAQRHQHQEAVKMMAFLQRETMKTLVAHDLARRTSYDADMQLAHAAWQTDNVPRLAGLLARHRPHPGDAALPPVHRQLHVQAYPVGQAPERPLPRPDEPDLRGFEWHYLHRLAHQDRLTLRWLASALKPGSAENLVLLAFSADGKTLATVSPVTPVRLWDRASGRALRNLAAPAGPVLGLTFADDGTHLLVVIATPAKKGELPFGLVRLQAVALGKEKPSLAPLAGTLTFQRLPCDGSAAAPPEPFDFKRLPAPVRFFGAGMKGSMRAMGRATFAIKGAFLTPIALTLSPDRKTLAVAAVYTPVPYQVGPSKQAAAILLWDLAAGRDRGLLRDHTTIVTTLAFSPDGKLLASGSLDRTIRLWESATGQSRGILGGEGGLVMDLAFRPDGGQLAAAYSDGTTRLWSPGSGTVQNTLKGHLDGLSALVFTPDGKELATGSGDGTVKFWDPLRGQGPISSFSNGGPVEALAFRAAARTLVAVERGSTARVLDALTGQQRARIRLKLKVPRVDHAAVSPDGGTLAVCWTGGTVEILDAATGEVRKSLTGPGVAKRIAFSADGKTLAVLAESGPLGKAISAVRLWDTATGTELRTLSHFAGTASSLALSSDGRFIAAATKDGTVCLWDARTGKEWFSTTAKDEVPCMAFSADGRRLAWASGEMITVAEVPEGKVALRIQGYAHWATRMVFSPDGVRLATAGGGVMSGRAVSVKLWDLRTGQEVLSLGGKADSVTALALSPDGRRLAAAFAEEQTINPLRNVRSEVRIWDATPIPDSR